MENDRRSGEEERSLLSRTRHHIVRLTPLWLLLLAPLFLFPRPAFAPAMLVLPLLWWLRKQEKGYFFPRTPLDWPILLMVMMVLVSLFATFNLAFSLPKLAGLLFHIAVFYAVVEAVQSRQGLLQSLGLYLLLGLIVVGLGIISTQWLFKVPLFNNITDRIPRLVQNLPNAETGIHPNQLAGALLWFFPLQLSLLWGMKAQSPTVLNLPPKLVKGFLWGTVVLTVLVFVLTQSRGGWLGGLAAIGFLGAAISKPVRWLVVAGAILALVGASFVGWPVVADMVLSDATTSVVGDFGSLGFRTEVWRAALWGLADFPFTGMGLGAFREVARLLYPLNVDPTYNIADAHNQFLQAGLDLGMLGLIAFLSLWLGTGYVLVSLYRRMEERFMKGLVLGIGSSLFGYFLFAFTSIVALGAKPGIFFWWLLALTMGLYRMDALAAYD